jgi:uracil-DNA glycosylase
MDVLDKWMDLLPWFDTDQCVDALTKLDEADQSQSDIPPYENVFDAYSFTSVSDIRVVILGQQPYSDATSGLAYSSIRDTKSLANIFTELELDYGSVPDGSLSGWAEQGVMLLNCSLTTSPNIDWSDLIDETVFAIAQETKNTVFMLWGNESVKRSKFISPNQHLMLLAGDPLDAGQFFGKRMFTKANQYLSKHNRGMINWYN